MAKKLLPFPKSTATKTAQQVMADYNTKKAAGQYVFEGGKWYEITATSKTQPLSSAPGYVGPKSTG